MNIIESPVVREQTVKTKPAVESRIADNLCARTGIETKLLKTDDLVFNSIPGWLINRIGVLYRLIICSVEVEADVCMERQSLHHFPEIEIDPVVERKFSSYIFKNTS